MDLKIKPANPAPTAHPASALAALLAILVLTPSLAACGDPGSQGETNAPAAEQTEDKTHVESHDHGDEKAEDDHGHDHGHDGPVRLSAEQRKEFGIVVAPAKAGSVTDSFTLPAEVRYNQDRLAHVVPRVSGIASEVNASEGDDVKDGALLAILDSRDLADARSTYLAALEREDLQEIRFRREEQLWDKKITSERNFLDAKSALAEARIARRGAEQKLYALGVADEQLDRIRDETETGLTAYHLRAPFDGHVVKRHIALGEFINADQQAFLLADLSTLWIDISVFPGDLDRVAAGQHVEILDEKGNVISRQTIAFVTPQIEEGTRTAIARIIAKSDGRLRPGMFLTARVKVDSGENALQVPRSAIQTVEEKPSVFIETEEGFEARPVTLGAAGEDSIVIVDGLQPGEKVVTEGAFTLKAEMSKDSFGGHQH